MTHDPWTLHAALSCPSCHVVGKVVQNDSEVPGNDDDGFDEPPFQCVECGQTWLDSGVIGDDSLKEARRHYMRRLEGMPYEAPKPKERTPSKLDATFKANDSVLKDYYRKPVEFTGAAPQRFTADDFTFHGPIRMPWPSRMGPIAVGNTDEVCRVTGVDIASGTITVEFIKK